MNKEQLALVFSDTESAEAFKRLSKYKLYLRRYVLDQVNQGNMIFFKDTLTIHDVQKIIKRLEMIAPELKLDSSISNYIEDRNYFINQRYRVGNDIKKRNTDFQSQFEVFRNTVDYYMVRPLTEEQMWNAFYMSVMKFVSNFSVPGSGKTATVLGTYIYYKKKDIVDKIVMVGPKNAFGSWIDEFKICFGITNDKFYLNIHDTKYTSTNKRKYALKLESGNKELILINYESLQSLEEELVNLIDDKTLLVFDEIHKIKNPTGQRAAVGKEVSKKAGSIIALTGTPIPNSYADIYNTLNILYREDYKDFFGFSINELKKAEQEQITAINEKMKPFFCRISKEDLGVPIANDDWIIGNVVTDDENRLYKIIYQTYKNNLFALLVRIYQLESNPELLMKSIETGDIAAVIDDESYNSNDITIKNYTEDITMLIDNIKMSTKTKATIELIKRLQTENKKVIVWCVFISSIRLLEELCTQNNLKVKCIYGEIPLDERLILIEQFKNGEIDVLITNPHTLAESVSLHTACHDAIYYEYSFNLVHLLQSKDRIHRLGLAKDQYTQYYFMTNHYIYNNESVSISERIYKRLKEKEDVMLNAISNDVLENVSSFEEDLETVFKNL